MSHEEDDNIETTCREPESNGELLLTPDMAQAFLLTQDGPRDVRKGKVQEYARALREGTFRYNPADAGIAFDWYGRLMNGQHRCHAVIETGIPMRVMCWRGLDPELRFVFDTGGTRNGNDALHMAKEAGGTRMAALANLHFRHLQACERQAAGGQYRLSGYWSAAKITNRDTVAIVQRFPALKAALYANSSLEPKQMIQPSVAAWVLYRLREIDHEKADVFWFQLGTGLNVEEGSAIHVARRYFLNRMNSRRRGSGQEDQEISIALIFKAWNAWVTNKRVRLFKWMPGEEPFPELLRGAQ